MKARYSQSRATKPRERIVVLIPEDEVRCLDEWAIPAGMPSRSAAIRTLIQKGLKAAQREAEQNGDGAQA